jgi:hypothetical protein
MLWDYAEVCNHSREVKFYFAFNSYQLSIDGMGFLEIGPAFHDFAIGYPPNNNAAKCDALIRSDVRAGPPITDHCAIVFSDQVPNLNVNIGKAFIRSAHVLLRSRGARSSSRWHVRTMIDKFRGEIHVGDIQILLVHKLLKVVAHKIFHFARGSVRFLDLPSP